MKYYSEKLLNNTNSTISELLKKDDVFFDIGANCDWYARLVKTFSTNKHKTFSFEQTQQHFPSK